MATNSFAIIATWASETRNKLTFSQEQIKNGIVFEAAIISNQLNGVFYDLSSASRFLQVTGGLYDAKQTYQPNEIASVLILQDGFTKRRQYMCIQANTTNKPPISGSGSTQSDIEVINFNGSNTEDIPRWKRVLDDTKIEATGSLVAGQMCLICSNSTTPNGRLKIKIFKGDALSCNFELVFSGFDYKTFEIPVCEYSEAIKKTRVDNTYGNIYYPGFGLMVTPNGIYIGVKSTTQADKIVVEYSDCNFKPVLSNIPFVEPQANTNLPYAIRKGGGSDIQNLGCVYSNIRNNANDQKQYTYDYYLFKNGFVDWISAMTLNTAYYHQFANGGMASTNIDVSDAVFRNVGAKSGQTVGVRLEPQLPNIKGEEGFDNGTGDYADWSKTYFYDGDSTKRFSSSDFGRHSPKGYSGAIYSKLTNPRNAGVPSSLTEWLPSVGRNDGQSYSNTYYYPTLAVDASRSNPIYSDEGDVRGITIVSRNKLQAF